MTKLTTDFNIDPYYDDYDEDKKFTRVLFKPGVAVQARELTTLQTMLQTQVSRFGDNIYKEGTIIDGCNISFDNKFAYVKILDLQVDGQPVAPSTYKGLTARGATTNVTATVNTYADGLVSQDPNLTTLYIQYTTTGINQAKKFNSDEIINLYDPSNTHIASVTAAGSVVNNAVGHSYAVRVSEGIIYAKGHFLQVTPGQVLASKFGTVPSGVSIGFDVSESIVTSDGDPSLLDNASGFNNENAPGADRLKLSPYLVALPSYRAHANANFLSLIDFQAGLPVIKRLDTQFDSVSAEMAKRTREESGNYSVRKNNFDVESIDANTTHFNVMIGPGLHYVNGYRAEQFNTTRLPVTKASTSANAENATVTTNMGYYILVNELRGHFDAHQGATVQLLDSPILAVSNTVSTSANGATASGGSYIGSAKIKALTYHSGTSGTPGGVYRLYLFDVSMNEGKRFNEVKSVEQTGQAHADLTVSRINELQNAMNLFPLGKTGVKALSNTDFVFRDSQTVFSSTDTVQLTPSYQLPYSGSLTLDQKRNFLIIPTTTDSNANITEGVPLDMDSVSASVSGNTVTFNIGGVTGSNTTSQQFEIIHNAKKSGAAAIKKTRKSAWIAIQANTHPAGVDGPWSFGMPDVAELEGVYVANSGIVANSSSETWMSEVTSSFNLIDGQKDNFYGLSSLQKKGSFSLGANQQLFVKAKVFDSALPASGSGYYTVDSYLDSDGVTPISPSDIPVYTSRQSGFSIDLRNVLDCRPQVAKTITVTTSEGGVGAPVNPSATEAFPNQTLFLAAPNEEFNTDIEFYLSRIDKVFVSEQGLISTVTGVPASRPVPPKDPNNGLTIAEVFIPPYPSLASKEARSKIRKNNSISVTPINTQRYTMKDIGAIDKRLKNMEYYISLSLLEQKTESMVVTDENGNDRFKNGILVDPAVNFDVADQKSGEFQMGLDATSGEFIPQFDQFWTDLEVVTADQVLNITNPKYVGRGVYTMPAIETQVMFQRAATTAIPCTENYYKFNGKLELDPPYDGTTDTNILPAKNVVNDTSTGVKDLVDNINNIFSTTMTDVQQIGSSTTSNTASSSTSDTQVTQEGYYGWNHDYWYDGYYGYGDHYYGGYDGYYHGWGYYPGYYYGGDYGTIETTTTTTDVTTTVTTNTYQNVTQQLTTGTTQSTENLGDFVKDVSFSPFMRARSVRIFGYGFRPLTKHYFYFDKKDISQYVKPAGPSLEYLDGNVSIGSGVAAFLKGTGALGADVLTDQKGRIFAIFNLPADTFLVGDRKLVVADESSIDNLGEASSMGEVVYNAYNFSVSKQEVTITTISPTFDINTIYGDPWSDSITDVSSETTTEVDCINYVDTYVPGTVYYNANGVQYTTTDDWGNLYYPYGYGDFCANTHTSYGNQPGPTSAGDGSQASGAGTGSGGSSYTPQDGYYWDYDNWTWKLM